VKRGRLVIPEATLASETQLLLGEITTIFKANYQEWQRLATEKLTQSERDKILIALDDRSVNLLELRERKWKLESQAQATSS
jgi:hypothetical protein